MSPPDPRPGLRDVSIYRAFQAEVAARLNTNECPYQLPDGFREQLARAAVELPLNRYPDREAVRLREALAAHTGHPPDGIWAANGSNETIQQLLLAYGGPGRRVALFEPTYQLHERIAWVAHADLVRVSLEPPFVIGPGHVRSALEAEPHVAFVCSPNNPTGNAQPTESVEALAASGATLVIVDEAYIEFGGKSAAGLLAGLPNLVVVRTFSKAFALAGARIGYCLAAPEVVEDLRRVRLPYHLSSLTQAAGLAALHHAEEAMDILEAVRAQRDRILEGLTRLEGFEPYPSDANFVLFRPPGDPKDLWQALLDRGVLVRDVGEVVPGCLRVTAGTEHEVDHFLRAIQEVAA